MCYSWKVSQKNQLNYYLFLVFIHFYFKADKYKELSERQYQVRVNLANTYAQSSLYSEMRTELDSLLGEQKAGRSSALEKITCVTPFWHQLRWIIYRSFKNFLGFPRVTRIQVIWWVILFVLWKTHVRAICLRVILLQGHTYLLLPWMCLSSPLCLALRNIQ